MLEHTQTHHNHSTKQHINQLIHQLINQYVSESKSDQWLTSSGMKLEMKQESLEMDAA